MEEARHVIERLERIDALRRTGAPANELLQEVRDLLAESERWLAAERGEDTEGARTALGDLHLSLAAVEREVVTRGSL